MERIVTVTFNPAIDKSTSVARLLPEVKLSCEEPVYQPGGGGINVARVVTTLGGNVTALFLAGGYTGEKFCDLLAQENIKMIPLKIVGQTRENLVIVDTATGQQYRFGMPGARVSEFEWKQCLDSLEAIQQINYLIVSGSLPPGIPPTIFKKLALIARNKEAKLIVDTSGEALREAVKCGVYLIKPSLRELSNLMNKRLISDSDIVACARTLLGKRKCEVVVISMGKDGAILITKKDSLRVMPPKVSVKSTVGAGDSMVGGMVMGLATGKSLFESFKYGVASGTAATLNEGSELCHVRDVDRLYRLMDP